MSYPLYDNQMTLYISSEHRNSGSGNDFYINIPNVIHKLPDKLVCQITSFNTNSTDVLILGVPAFSIQLRSDDISNINSFSSYTKSNSNILVEIDRTVAGAQFWYYKAYDKTFQSFITNNFFGRTIHFYTTTPEGELANGINHVNFVMNVFWNSNESNNNNKSLGIPLEPKEFPRSIQNIDQAEGASWPQPWSNRKK